MRGSTDPDTLETGEWIVSLRAVLRPSGSRDRLNCRNVADFVQSTATLVIV